MLVQLQSNFVINTSGIVKITDSGGSAVVTYFDGDSSYDVTITGKSVSEVFGLIKEAGTN